MSRRPRPPRLFRQCWPVVWLAGRMVPAARRADWYGKWRHEIWHWAAFLEEAGRLTPRHQAELVAHCWRAFGDAFWVRFDRERFTQRLSRTLRSPGFALALPLAMLITLGALTGFFAQTRALLLPAPMRSPERVARVQYLGEWWTMSLAAVPSDWVPIWRKYAKTVDGIAEYSLEERSLSAGSARVNVGVARVSPGFFEVTEPQPLLGRFFREDEASCADCVVLSAALWRSHFGSRSDIVGKTLDLGSETVTVIGVAPERFWLPSNGVGLWRPGALVTGQPAPRRMVGVVVRVKDGAAIGEAERDLQQIIRAMAPPLGPGRPTGSVQMAVFQNRARQTLATFAVLVGVALFATVIAGLWRFHPQRAAVGHWTALLAAKTLLLLVVCALFSIELTPQIGRAAGRSFDSAMWALSLWMCLALSVAVLLWAVHDQRARCPVCLSRLQLPVLVGEPSRMLFGFGATELVCPRGHGLLHISESHCSWIDQEEWTGLDASWQNLFDDAPREE